MTDRHDTSTYVLTDELYNRFHCLMRTIRFKGDENEIQRQLGRLYQVYKEDFCRDEE